MLLAREPGPSLAASERSGSASGLVTREPKNRVEGFRHRRQNRARRNRPQLTKRRRVARHVPTKTVSVHTDARYHEPTSGRFLSADPLGQASSPSLYDFAGGDPINFFDPTGRCKNQTNTNNWGQYPLDPNNPQQIQDYYRNPLAIAKKALESVQNTFAQANEQYLADQIATVALSTPFSDITSIDGFDDAHKIAAPLIDSATANSPFLKDPGNEYGVIGDTILGTVSGANAIQKIEDGDNSGWVDLAGAAVGSTTALLKAATLGPRPLIDADTVLAADVEIAGTAGGVGGLASLGLIGEAKIYYKNQDAQSSEQTVDAVSNNLSGMIQTYRQLVQKAKAAGVSP